jgi:hypothetical protein
MPLVVENGTNIPNANCYVTVVFADEYLNDSFNASTWSCLTLDEKETMLIASSRWLDQRAKWSGSKVSTDQSMRWPRTGAVDCDELPVSQEDIPVQLKHAVCELACFYAADEENNPTRFSEKLGLTEITVDVITLKFQDGYNANATKFLPGLNDILCSLGRVSTATGRGFAPIQKV